MKVILNHHHIAKGLFSNLYYNMTEILLQELSDEIGPRDIYSELSLRLHNELRRLHHNELKLQLDNQLSDELNFLDKGLDN